MINGAKRPGQAAPTSRGKAFFIVTTALISALFTGGIAFGVQTVMGGTIEPGKGVLIDGAVRQFDISVKEWSFEPSVIRVNPGEKVRFIITSQDVWHGLAINELAINVAVPGGKTVVSEAVIPEDITDGVHTMYCSVFCGLGHPYLKGKIIIGDPKLFLGVGLGKTLPYIATLAMAVIFATTAAVGVRRAR